MTAAADWIARRKALADAATGAPWFHYPSSVVTGPGVAWSVHAATPDPIQSAADAEWIADARTSLPQAVAALDAVLRLHRDAGCTCGTEPRTHWCPPIRCNDCRQPYPCSTVRVITDHLED